jgi:hypothetical protein
MHPIDLARFKANGQTVATRPRHPPRHRAGQWFILGPLPGDWIGRAAKLPGKALAVALALWFAAGLAKSRTIKLTAASLDRFVVNRYSAYRGLGALERAGLVTVERHAGRCPMVTLLDWP